MTDRLRDATPADLEAILALLPRLAAFELPPRRVAEHLWVGDADLLRAWARGEVPEGLVLVAETGDGTIAGVAFTRYREELLSHRPSAHLEVLVVRPGHEGRGLGRALVEETERRVRAGGAESLSLHVFAANTRARALYQHLGYDGELIRYLKHLA